MLTHGSLFTGIGGMDLGFHLAGMRTVWQVEIEEYARQVLERHWPGVPKFADIREFPPKADLEYADVVSGGFPCQNISVVGKRDGIEGSESSLWREYRRTLRDLCDRGQQPRYVVVENSGALLVRGIDSVLGDLASLGFDAEWTVLRAADTGGVPHERKRFFAIAYPSGTQARAIGLWRCGVSETFDRAGLVSDIRERSIDGIPGWLEQERRAELNKRQRQEGVGNAVCVPVAEVIGNMIVKASGRREDVHRCGNS